MNLSLLENARVAILGAGPTGLGAAYRLQELGFHNFTVYEKESYAGGLAASFTDSGGFTWDVGGHVQFSHYTYFDRLMDRLLGEEWLNHERESWVWICDRFVPYPFQNNIRYLPDTELRDCVAGLIRLYTQQNGHTPANFEEWIHSSFGEGIARHFLMPYNFKVWAYPPRDLSFQWVGERVAKVDLERVVLNILEKRDDVSWGPNNTFRFPQRGGTGEIWRRLAACLPQGSVVCGKELVRLDTQRRKLFFADGGAEDYDILISTIPLDTLAGLADMDEVRLATEKLRFSTVHIAGIGLRGAPPPAIGKKCWMYFPESTSPFYRATVFSNYSPHNVPDIQRYWSLMLEVSESPAKPVDRQALPDATIQGLLATKLIESRNDIVDVWHHTAPHGYPTPSLERDGVLNYVLPALEDRQIFSRGRFGAWKYEVSNQDHSLMQGVELVDRLATGAEEVTLRRPNYVNTRPKS